MKFHLDFICLIISLNLCQSSFLLDTLTKGERFLVEKLIERVSSNITQQHRTVKKLPVHQHKYLNDQYRGSPLNFDEFPSKLQYSMFWKSINSTNIKVEFSLAKESNPFPRKNLETGYRTPLSSSISNFSSALLKLIPHLKYYRFSISSYPNQNEILLEKRLLDLDNVALSPNNEFTIVLNLFGLNQMSRYSICIKYYHRNTSVEAADFYLCQEILVEYENNHHSKYGPLFILTQYSVILISLIVLQILFSLRKRHIANIVHLHLLSKAQRFRSSFSSISLFRQSVSSNGIGTSDETNMSNDFESPKTRHMTKTIRSSPALEKIHSINLCQDSSSTCYEHETFNRLSSNKNHVQFLLGELEDSDEMDENEKIDSLPTSTLHEPYEDRPDALLSMAHILDIDKPWYKYTRPSISL